MTETKTVTKVKPSDPPQRMRYDWAAIAEQLRAAPGEWFEIFRGGSAHTAGAIQRGNMIALPPDEFEATTSDNTRNAPRTCTLHMRFNPKRKNGKRKF